MHEEESLIDTNTQDQVDIPTGNLIDFDELSPKVYSNPESPGVIKIDGTSAIDDLLGEDFAATEEPVISSSYNQTNAGVDNFFKTSDLIQFPEPTLIKKSQLEEINLIDMSPEMAIPEISVSIPKIPNLNQTVSNSTQLDATVKVSGDDDVPTHNNQFSDIPEIHSDEEKEEEIT